MDKKPIHGRGAQRPTNNKYETFSVDSEYFEDIAPEQDAKTSYQAVFPKSIINKVPVPDVGMDWGINPYQGCEHGCAYCYARPTHQYWGMNPGNEFEQKILYKKNAPELLTAALSKKTWKPSPIMFSGNTDCYQPLERKLRLTRQLLQVCWEFRQPVGIITKNASLLRDLDIIEKLAKHNLIYVAISLTTLDEEVRRKMEPRTSSAANRLKAIKVLSDHNVPVIAQMGPVIPGLTDHEIPSVIQAAAQNGAQKVSYIMVRLNGEVESIFSDWIQSVFPNKAQKVLNGIRSTHGGKLGETRSHIRMRGEGVLADHCRQLFQLAQAKYLPSKNLPPLNCQLFRIPPKGQLQLF